MSKYNLSLEKAATSIQELESGAEVPQVEVVFEMNSSPLWVYQTSDTMDVGGVSSKLKINHDSGAYDACAAFMRDNGIEINDDDDVFAFGAWIGEQMNVQSTYDQHMSEYGEWVRGDGMDANSEVFVPNGKPEWR